ncbi:MAG: hypothetical protein JNM06_04770, partial [Blastocatellia bacterium]|nr:hypothetical protein [Blastocatellia bacterium]
YKAAAVDAVGIAIDSAATAVPIIPGGAGTIIKGIRGVDKALNVVQSGNKIDNAIDATNVARKADKVKDANSATKTVEFSGGTNKYVDDLSKVTGKGAKSRNKAVDSVLKEDFKDLNVTHKPQYSPYASTGVAKKDVGTHIGKKSFNSRNDLRNTIVHEELHHRWWKKGRYNHHPKDSASEKKFYNTINRYERMRGWKK